MAGNGTLNSSTNPYPPYSRFWEQVHSGFLVVVIVAALFGNGFVCMAVYRVRRLQKVSNYFLVSLAVSDILVLLAIPFRIYFELNTVWLLGEHTCKFWIFMDLLCSTASIVNLSVISVDRYLALSKCLRYLTIMTVSRCRILIGTVWMFAFTLAAFSLHTWSPDGGLISYPVCAKNDKTYYTVSTILGIIVPLIVLIVLYCLVFKIALEQQKKIMRNNNNSPPSSQDGTTSVTTVLRPQAQSSPRRFAIRELKATKTLIIVVGAFLVCWLPLSVLVVMQQYAPNLVRSWPLKTQEILGQLLLYTLPQFNSCINPYIYTCHNSEFRAVFKETFRKLLPFVKLQSKSEMRRRSPTLDTDFVSTGI